ncbi:Hemolysin-type calcium-binding region [Thalassoporum mexicanum PCC 7367]|uniref:calcium-binding protein n=1 Tax=Thalassoporum mexicanum TaxID=3457544 RepID=UPI00029FC3C6|nr:calcium-binding protein [Pseudanabaena sp. PCC 7367]AFY70205.1 Hemolysin-type calcium-binding region [Pseudanabaena sp. PCC 7367]
MVNLNFLGGTISDDNTGNLNLPDPFIHPSVGTIPAAPPTPIALYTPPTTDFVGLDLVNYLFSIVQGAAVVPNESAFLDYTNNNDNEVVPNWSGFGPVRSGGIRALNGDDIINGSTDNDVVNGNLGADQLFGGAGYDYLRGGRDNDLIFGFNGNDILNGNRGNDQIFGEDGNDFLRGGKDNDSLFGGNGEDILIGDVGTDRLSGGLDADAFFFRTDSFFGESNLSQNEFAADWILDFNPGEGDYIVANGASRNTIGLDDSRNIDGAGGSDTVITFSGQVLGVVLETSAGDVFNNFYSVGLDSALVTSIG